MSESYLEIQLDQQPIELYKLLKIADLVTGGGEAKVVITQGYVQLNGEVEYQKRKKVYHNDIIEFNGEMIQVVINEEFNEDNNLQTTPDNTNKSSLSFPKEDKLINDKQKKTAPSTRGTTKRRPISF